MALLLRYEDILLTYKEGESPGNERFYALQYAACIFETAS